MLTRLLPRPGSWLDEIAISFHSPDYHPKNDSDSRHCPFRLLCVPVGFNLDRLKHRPNAPELALRPQIV
jgi:hypothetical protein